MPTTVSDDEPYSYRRPTHVNTFPFTSLIYARLLVLRGQLELDYPARRHYPREPATVQLALL